KSKNEDEKRNNQPFRWGIRGNQVRRFKLQPSQECVQQDYQGHRNHNQRNFAGRGRGFIGGVYHQTSDRQHWSINPVGQNLLSSVKDHARKISTITDIELEPKIKNNRN
ncbi:hypothetical protein BpHYR1_050010, partial [Brachionus plicatilis]